jgi:hypothetical protein
MLGAVLSCAKDSTPPLVPTSIAVSTSSLTFDAIGASQSLTVTVNDQNGTAMASVTPTFTSSAPSVATVGGSTAATVTSVSNGSAIVAISAGKATTNVAVTVAQVPASVTTFAGNNQTARVGSALPIALAVRVADRLDQPVPNVSVTFTAGVSSGTIAGSPAITSAQGIATVGSWTLGTTPGVKSVAATVGSLPLAAFNATATTGVAALMSISAGNNQVAATGATLPVAPAVLVTDQYANPVSGATVTFAVASGGGSATGTTATTNGSGLATIGSWTMGASAGTNTLTASSTGLTSVTFSAIAGSVPVVASVSPTPLVPGASMTVTGTGFSGLVSGNSMRVGGVTAAITAASTTQLTATVPCAANGATTVTVTAGGMTSAAGNATLSGNVRVLAAGQAFVATSSAQSLCNELPAAGGAARYLVSVWSTSTSQNTLVDFELGGNPASSSSAARIYAPLRATRAAAAESEDARRDRLHFEHLERERVRVEELRALERQTGTATTLLRSERSITAAPVIGDRRLFYWNYSTCADTLTRITARVLYSGTHAVIWEDTSNAVLAAANTTVADRYQRLGQIFDQDQYDVVRTTFGDPLRRDALTDNDQRVHMLFTHRVNDIGGVAAYVTSVDQYPRSTCATSNFGEFFYGSVPTREGSNLESTAYPDGWFNFMNRTVVHEVKHIASMAARVANNASFEQSWLEEGTARLAEEVWARQALHHTAFGGNSGYGTAATNGLFCDFNSSNATCLANDALRRPSYGVRRQFNEILPKLSAPWDFSLFGDGTGQSGSVFYQTVWSFVRYVIDNYASSDASFLTALTNATATGTTNIANAAGVPPSAFNDLVGGWSLALYADDYPGLTGAANTLKFQTWNLRNIYNALHLDPLWVSRFPTAYPIVPSALSFGSFTASQTGVRGGANVYFEFSGVMTSAQVLSLRTIGGGAPSTQLRIAIARLQ